MKCVPTTVKRLKKSSLWLGSFVALLCTQSALAASPTLDRINSTNTFKIGYSHNVVPFSYLNTETNQPIGFGMDISLHIAEALKKQLNKPDLKIEYVSTPFDDRWKMHSKGEVDIHCSTSTNTVERQKLAHFSYNYFVAQTRIMVRKDSGITKYNDLAGKSVAIIDGTSSAAFFKSKKNLFKVKELKFVTSITNALDDAFALLKSGEVAAVVYEDSLLLSMLLQNYSEHENYEILGKSMAIENYGCTMQYGDDEFKQVVNNAILDLIQSKKIYALYDKWFTQPIPPLNNSAHFPMNESTQKMLISPNDKAVGQFEQ